MVMAFLKKLLSGDAASSEAPTVVAAATPATVAVTGKGPAVTVAEAEPRLEEFVGFVVRALVDKPEAVTISTAEKGEDLTILIACEKRDIGKIIGKSGKTIAAIRTLVNGAGGKQGRRMLVEVVE